MEEHITKSYNKSDSIRFFKLETAIENIPIVSILVASLYRNLKLVSSAEGSSNVCAQQLYGALNQSPKIGNLFTNDELAMLFNTSLSVPTSESQLKQQKFWVSPLVPEIGNYGLASRNTEKGSWNPGNFILEIIANYSFDLKEFIEIIKSLRLALEVNSKDNDIWSICIESEFKAISDNLKIAGAAPFDEQCFIDFYIKNTQHKKLLCNANFSKITVIDLKNIIKLKDKLTRQKWIGFFEGFIRLTMFNHIIYTINLSKNYFDLIESKLLKGSTNIEKEDILRFLNLEYNLNDIRIKVGTPRKKYIKDHVEGFAFFNALISSILEFSGYANFLDFDSENEFIEITESILKKFKNIDSFKEFKIKFQNDNEMDLIDLKEDFSSLKNIKEGLGYLCSRKMSSKGKYISDVNFLFDKSGSSLNSPYFLKISPGLISILTSLIFLRKEDSNSFISGLEFISGLNEYNIQLSINDISTGNIKDTMLSLGIVIDCPDTEGGVLIIKPGWIK